VSSVVYLQGSVGSVFVGPTGHNHKSSLAEPNDDVPFAVDCAECEPYLVKDFGAVYNRVLVPQTDRQIAAKEQATKDGNSAVSEAAKALAMSAKAAMNSTPSEDNLDDRIAAAVAKAMSAQAARQSTPSDGDRDDWNADAVEVAMESQHARRDTSRTDAVNDVADAIRTAPQGLGDFRSDTQGLVHSGEVIVPAAQVEVVTETQPASTDYPAKG
jgi:hypothetical protein